MFFFPSIIFYRSASSSGQTSCINVTIFSDSIFRGLGNILCDLHANVNWNVCVFPGANIDSLRHHIKHLQGDFIDNNTSFVLLNCGTNNLQQGVWNKDKHSFLKLYISVSERFPRARIIFSAILPRWDREDFYIQSLFYNRELSKLAKSWSCKFFDASDLFVRDDYFFVLDGLHLNFCGKFELAQRLCTFFDLASNPSPKSQSSPSRIPPELKKLFTAKKPKKELPWTETNLDLVAYKKREKYGKYYPPTTARKPKAEPSQERKCKPICITFIPYVEVLRPRPRHGSQHSDVALPKATSCYVAHKQKAKRRKRRRRKTKKRRQRKKVLTCRPYMLLLNVICYGIYVVHKFMYVILFYTGFVSTVIYYVFKSISHS